MNIERGTLMSIIKTGLEETFANKEKFDKIMNPMFGKSYVSENKINKKWGGFSWLNEYLSVTDLPSKAQKFIDLMNLDVSNFKFIHLTKDTNGGYIRDFRDPDIRGKFDPDNRKIFLINPIQVRVTIHELTHLYLYINDFDTKAISEKFIETHGRTALSNYASICRREADSGKCSDTGENLSEDMIGCQWDEVVCEIVATYGRRGQFNKIKELFNC
jgi:hypothetical protein